MSSCKKCGKHIGSFSFSPDELCHSCIVESMEKENAILRSKAQKLERALFETRALLQEETPTAHSILSIVDTAIDEIPEFDVPEETNHPEYVDESL